MMRVVESHERFGAIYEASYGAVRRYVTHRGITGQDADDLVAETFTVAWRRLDQLPEDDPLPWLFAVARNHWRNHIRKRHRDRKLISRLGGPPDVVEDAPGPDATRISDIRRALDGLSDADREILLLVAWDELSPSQAADSLGCSPGTARVRLHRARNRLARALGETIDPMQTEPGREHRPQEVRDGT